MALPKQQPGVLSYGTWGQGGLAHQCGLQLQHFANLELLYIPFQGSPPALYALLGGQIDMMFLGPVLAMKLQQAGKIRVIRVTAGRRLSVLERWAPHIS